MSILITILIVIASLIGFILLLALFTKKDYAISREITIEKPVTEVFSYVKYIKNQENYNKWVMVDPNLRKSFRGIDGTVGFVFAWDGNQKAGKGEQEIVKIKDNDHLDLEIRFIKPFEGIAQTQLITKSTPANQTTVTWSMKSAMKYPMNITLLFMSVDKLLGTDLEISLKRLKSILEGAV
jgi:hypothetical protein